MALPPCSTENLSLRRLLEDERIHQAQPHHRGYRWDEDRWRPLWRDLRHIANDGNSPAHYMGALVLKSAAGNHHQIVDGLQRLATASIIITACAQRLCRLALDGIDADCNVGRAEKLRATLLVRDNPDGAGEIDRIQLSEPARAEYLRLLSDPICAESAARDSATGPLGRAFDWFTIQITEAHGTDGEAITGFAEALADALSFTVFRAEDDIGAYGLIETISGSDDAQSTADLFKNHLLAMLDPDIGGAQAADEAMAAWEDLIESLNGEPLTDFLRCFWASRNATVAKKELLGLISNKVNNHECVDTFLGRAGSAAGSYALLSDRSHPVWSREQRKYLELLEMIGIGRTMPCLLACHIKFSGAGGDEFDRLLRAVAALAFRCRVCGVYDGEFEHRIHGWAREISSGALFSAAVAIDELKSLCPDDEAFVDSFSHLDFDISSLAGRKIASHILLELGDLAARGGRRSAESSCSIEFISELKGAGADEAGDDRRKDGIVHRLGNMVIAAGRSGPGSDNSPIGAVEQRISVGSVEMSLGFCEPSQAWDERAILDRQRQMAERAKDIWRIDLQGPGSGDGYEPAIPAGASKR